MQNILSVFQEEANSISERFLQSFIPSSSKRISFLEHSERIKKASIDVKTASNEFVAFVNSYAQNHNINLVELTEHLKEIELSMVNKILTTNTGLYNKNE